MTASFWGNSGIPPEDGPYAVKASNVVIVPDIANLDAENAQDAFGEIQLDLTNLTALVGTKLASSMNTARILGRATAGTGAVEELDAASVRTLCALVPGTNIQAYSANLQSLSGLTLAANKGISSTGVNTLTTFDLTAFGRGLVAATDNASLLTAAGLGGAANYSIGTSGANVPLLNGSNTWSSQQTLTGALALSSTAPIVYFTETDQGANAKNWRLWAESGVFQLQTLTDAFGSPVSAFSVSRSSGNPAAFTFHSALTGGVVFAATPMVANSNPIIRFQDSDASANEKEWRINVNGQFMEFQTGTDALSWDTAWFMQRTAGVVTGIQFNKATQFNGPLTATSSVNISSANPVVNFYENDVGTDLKRSRFITNSAALSFQIGNDADSSYTSVFTIGRSTNVSATVTFPSTTSVVIDGPLSAKDTLNTQTGTTYTLQASDNGKVVELENAAAITLTVPSSLPLGFNCIIAQTGAGQVTVQAGSGATLNAYPAGGVKTPGQWGEVSLRVRSNSGGSAAVAVMGGGTT